MGQSNRYQVYVEKTMTLAKTIVVKSTESASSINEYNRLVYGEGSVGLDPRGWKYYMNLAGQYHSTDEPMTVRSMDDLSIIDFTVDNLRRHVATAKAYAYGTQSYNELKMRYPEQEPLILGVLYPIDIERAIVAEDGEILGFPDGLVEPNEDSLIPRLQDWIYKFKYRWGSKQYGLSDNLWPPTHLGIMYLKIPEALFSIRLELCKTREAHSFHYTEYLASHGLLDEYLAVMPLEQALWFYRNVDYLNHNAGKTKTYRDLVENTLSMRGIPLSSFKYAQDLTGLGGVTDPADPTPQAGPARLDPLTIFERQPENSFADTVAGDWGVEEMLRQEVPAARDNQRVAKYETGDIDREFQLSKSSVKLTKALQSGMTDTTDSEPYSLPEILLNQWIYSASTGEYRAFVSMNNPVTGERMSFSAMDAAVMMFYAFYRSVGIVLDDIPKALATKVILQPRTAFTRVRASCDRELIPDSTLEQLYWGCPEYRGVMSVDSHWDLCNDIHAWGSHWRTAVANTTHYQKRGNLRNAVLSMFGDCIVDISGGTKTYADWFSQRNLSFGDLSPDTWGGFAKDITAVVTGADLRSKATVRTVQAAMIRLMTQMSSYSVQYLKEINQSRLHFSDWNVVTPGDMQAKQTDVEIANLCIDPVRRLGVLIKPTVKFIVKEPVSGSVEASVQMDTERVNLPPLVRPYGAIDRRLIYARAPLVDFRVTDPGKLPPGYAEWYKLPDEKERQFKDVYNQDFWNSWDPPV